MDSGVARGDAGGASAPATAAPHAPQKRAAGRRATPHPAHRASSATPHCSQNRLPSGFSERHWEQIIFAQDTPHGSPPGSDDLLVDAGRDDAVDVDRLRDVLEGLRAQTLENEVLPDAFGCGRTDNDVTALRERREARRDVRRRAARGERPALAA